MHDMNRREALKNLGGTAAVTAALVGGGDAYWRVGRRHEARFQWRRALSFKPEKKESDKIQGKLKKGLGKAKPITETDAGG